LNPGTFCTEGDHHSGKSIAQTQKERSKSRTNFVLWVLRYELLKIGNTNKDKFIPLRKNPIYFNQFSATYLVSHINQLYEKKIIDLEMVAKLYGADPNKVKENFTAHVNQNSYLVDLYFASTNGRYIECYKPFLR
jgi:hypothetical protein